MFCLSQGSATVTIQFDAGRHSINCTTLQAVVLLVLGNDTNSLSFEQVRYKNIRPCPLLPARAHMQLFLDMLHTCPTLQLATCTGIDKGDLKRIVGSLALASKATRIVAKVRRLAAALAQCQRQVGHSGLFSPPPFGASV